ncbi:unnamed protein product [Onchocerca flexuosa]|uniref:Ovule protein n=1 Tax=Onchocerca flexuosa TaxID=387005 RepID=A0A183GYL1_9BILA|nr:unnamed protein product [Onchocerca flexuosa]
MVRHYNCQVCNELSKLDLLARRAEGIDLFHSYIKILKRKEEDDGPSASSRTSINHPSSDDRFPSSPALSHTCEHIKHRFIK